MKNVVWFDVYSGQKEIPSEQRTLAGFFSKLQRANARVEQGGFALIYYGKTFSHLSILGLSR